jgi:hypothetical protein
MLHTLVLLREENPDPRKVGPYTMQRGPMRGVSISWIHDPHAGVMPVPVITQRGNWKTNSGWAKKWYTAMIQFLQDPDGNNSHTITPDNLPAPFQAVIASRIPNYNSVKRLCAASVIFQGATLRAVGGASDTRHALQISRIGLGFQLHMCRLALGPPGPKWGKYSYRATCDMCSAIDVSSCYRIDHLEEPWEPFRDLDQPVACFYRECQWYLESSHAKANRYFRAGGHPPLPPLAETDRPTSPPSYHQEPQQVGPRIPSSSAARPSGLQVPLDDSERNHQPAHPAEARRAGSQEPTHGLPPPGANNNPKSKVDSNKEDKAPQQSEHPGTRSKAKSQAGPPVPPTQQYLPGLTNHELLQALRKIPRVRSIAELSQTLSDPDRRDLDVEEFFRIIQALHPDDVSPDIPLCVMWNLGYACANSSNEQRPDSGINPAGSICRLHRFRICCTCGGHHSTWECREIKTPIDQQWAWPRAPQNGWETQEQRKLKYRLTHARQDTMWRPLDVGEMPLPISDYLLDGDESAGDSPQLPPERVAEPPGNLRFPSQARHKDTKPHPRSGQPAGSSQSNLASASPLAKWKSAIVPPWPKDFRVAQGQMPADSENHYANYQDLPGPATAFSAAVPRLADLPAAAVPASVLPPFHLNSSKNDARVCDMFIEAD